jgi:putative DNA primase/helicase
MAAPLFDNIPEELTSLQQFCVRVGKRPFIRDGKLKNSFSGEWTDTLNERLTFSEALEALQKPVKVWHEQRYHPVDGMGFLVIRSSLDVKRPLGGDLDCCRDPVTGAISPWAAAFLQDIQPFYCEVSPSKCGLRFFVWGHLPNERASVFGNGPQDDQPEETREKILTAKPKAREKLEKGEPVFNGLEFYESGRHLTITGECLADYCYPSEDRSASVSQALEPFLDEDEAEDARKAADEAKREDRGGLTRLDILDVIDTTGFIESGGQLFGSHPTLGSTTGRNLVVNPGKGVWAYMHNGINSGGDAWTWLACECGAVQWERAGHGALKDATVMRQTLEHAVKRGLVQADILGAKGDGKNAETTAHRHEPSGEDAAKPKQDIEFEDVTDEKELSNGDITWKFNHSKAADAIIKKLPVALGTDGKIYYWTGTTWTDKGETVIHNRLHELAGKLLNRYAQKEVVAALQNLLAFSPVQFDSNPYLLGVSNGVIDLRTKEFRPYRPDDHISLGISTAYDPEAKCPGIEKFLEEVCPNEIDRKMLIDWIALHAFRKSFPFILFLVGRGRNGKGVYEAILQALYSVESFSFMTLEEINKSNFAKSNLIGKRGLIVSEIGDDTKRGKGRIPTKFLKLSSGEGYIDGDRKNTSRILFPPTIKATIDTNDMPEIADNSKGWEERFLKADMPWHFVDNPDPTNPRELKKDPHLKDKLTSPEELSGLLNLVIDRAADIAKTETINKRSGAEYMAEYKQQSGSVKEFLERYCEFCPKGPHGEPITEGWRVDQVYRAYTAWAESINGHVVLDKQFGGFVSKFCPNAYIKKERDPITKAQSKKYWGFMFFEDEYKEDMEARS